MQNQILCMSFPNRPNFYCPFER